MADDFSISTKWGQTTAAEKLGDQRSPSVAQSGAFRKRTRPKKPREEVDLQEEEAEGDEGKEAEPDDSGKVLDILV